MNQPKLPRCIIAGENAKSNAENNPALVPLSVLTNAKTMIVVNDPRITGKRIVKSKSEIFTPNALYKKAAAM